MNMNRKKLWILVLIAASAVLTACRSRNMGQGGSGTGRSVSQGTDITAAVPSDFTTMDPMDTSDTLSGGIQRLMMDGLFGFDDEMGIIPMLAAGYEANEDATEFTIFLREGIRFTDGTPWDAEAAKANLDRWGDETLGLKRTNLLCHILKNTEIVDDYTVKITLESPFGALIPTLAHPACVCVSPKVLEKGSGEAAKAPVGTGQYTFVEWIAGNHAAIALNRDWWGYDAGICGGTALADPDAGFRTITFKPVPEDAARVAMLQSGEAQLIWPVPAERIDALRADPGLSVGQEAGIVVRYLMMNNQKAPFDDRKVRQAVNYAINKEAYCAVVKNGLATPATSIIGPAVQYHKGNAIYGYDVEKAKALLAEAGYPDGFTTTLVCASTTANRIEAEFLRQQLEQAGITLEVHELESGAVRQKVEDSTVPGAEAEVDLYIIGWSPSTGDADWGIRPLMAAESEPPMGYNICYYENEEVDRLLEEALSTADDEKRAKAYAEAQDIIWEESPLVCLANDANTWATARNVIDVKVFPDNCINLRNGKMVLAPDADGAGT